jgi:hypothetical protein
MVSIHHPRDQNAEASRFFSSLAVYLVPSSFRPARETVLRKPEAVNKAFTYEARKNLS